tara:strand:+ start:6490 stop:7206 length:717 start_codon:yes stop_codon:yes gene_type:complete
MKPQIAKKIHKKVKNFYNKNAFEFDKRRKAGWQEMQFLFLSKAKKQTCLFYKYLKKGDKILDLGCGNGRFYELFKKHEADYIGLDNSKKLIKIARDKYPGANFIIEDALNLPFRNNRFSKIYAIALLHHIPSRDLREHFMDQAMRVLKPGGLLILTVWNLWKIKKLEIIKQGLFNRKLDFGDIQIPFAGQDKCFFHAFKLKELKKLAQNAGFKIIDSGYFSWRNREKANIYLVVKKIK